MRLSTVLSAAVLVGAASAQAQTTPIELWQIIEGQGLTDNYVYLGMSRKEARAKAPHGECDPGNSPYLNQCSFSALGRDDAPFLTLVFNDKSKLIQLVVDSSYSRIKWPTTAGATDAMTGNQVRTLYPGAVVQDLGNGEKVIAARQGYEFTKTFICVPSESCSTLVTHTVTKPKKK